MAGTATLFGLSCSNPTSSYWNGTTRTASTWAQVSTAVGASSDGDIVILEDGAYSADSTITTTKAILIRARNVGSADITHNNGSGALFNQTVGNVNHLCFFGMDFLNGTGSGSALPSSFITIGGSGSKLWFIGKCTFEIGQFVLFQAVHIDTLNGGVLWGHGEASSTYTFYSNVPNGSGEAGGSGSGSGCLLLKSSKPWSDNDTMGDADTNGTINAYVEDLACFNVFQCPDTDDLARAVVRHFTMDGSTGITHGYSSLWGGRHFEYYNGTFKVLDGNRTIANRYFWIRAGTGLVTDCVINDASNTSSFGHANMFDIGDSSVAPSGSYPFINGAEGFSRQPGWGEIGGVNASSPIYMWNNTGARESNVIIHSGWTTTYLTQNRDYFIDNGAKPGYTKYTYPHPLRPSLADNV